MKKKQEKSVIVNQENSLLSPQVLGGKTTNPTKKGSMGGTKLKSDFFADFDLDDEPEKEEKEEEVKEEKSIYSNKFSYNEKEKSSNNSTYSPNNTYSSPKEPKIVVGSDSFVPSRSKKLYMEGEKKEQPNTGVASQNFSKAKSISSTQMFGEENKVDQQERRERLSKFEGSKSISSSEYYGEPENNDLTATDLASKLAFTAKADLSNVKEFATESAKKIHETASNWWSSYSNS